LAFRRRASASWVRALEERLGVRLVERTTHSVAATAAGERLFERLRPVPADIRLRSNQMLTNPFLGHRRGPLKVM
jgi:DNA-binding transcriptional LysR family regulator